MTPRVARKREDIVGTPEYLSPEILLGQEHRHVPFSSCVSVFLLCLPFRHFPALPLPSSVLVKACPLLFLHISALLCSPFRPSLLPPLCPLPCFCFWSASLSVIILRLCSKRRLEEKSENDSACPLRRSQSFALADHFASPPPTRHTLLISIFCATF